MFKSFIKFRVDWEESVAKKPASTLNHAGNSYAASSDSVESKRDTYIIVYSCIMVFGIIAFLSRSFSFYQMCIRISINLHDMVFRGVTRAKMIFFNNNPSGRILNRFARDINNVDSLLPNAMFDVVDVSYSFIFTVFFDCKTY